MRVSRLVIAAGLALCAAHGASRGQTVFPAVPVFPVNGASPPFLNETAVGVSATNPAVLIAAAVQRLPDNVVIYSISNNYGQTWTYPQRFDPTPLAPCFDVTLSSDPGVTSDASGNLYLSATAYDGGILTQGIFLGRMPHGSSAITAHIAATPCVSSGNPYVDGDRARLVFGPGPNGAGEWGLLGYYNFATTGTGYIAAFGAASIQSSATLGKVWNPPFPITLAPPTLERSAAVHPSIIRRGATKGHAVVARGIPPPSGAGEGWPPVVYFSTDQGANWLRGDPNVPQPQQIADTLLDRYRVAGTVQNQPIDYFGPTGTGVTGRFSSDIGADPASDDTVYVVVNGRTNDDPTNTDLFLFKSTDGGRSFPANQRLRLTDGLLQGHAPAGSIQFNPAMCIDAFGGINVLYYQVDPAIPGQLRAYYARLTNFNAQDPTQMGRFVAPLSPTFNIPGPGTTSSYIGDFQMIATSDCYVYACFMSTQLGRYDFFVSRIQLSTCTTDIAIADFNTDGAVNTTDPIAYTGAYAAGQPAADLTGDQVLNTSDFVTYMNAYTAVNSTGP